MKKMIFFKKFINVKIVNRIEGEGRSCRRLNHKQATPTFILPTLCKALTFGLPPIRLPLSLSLSLSHTHTHTHTHTNTHVNVR